jgi:hypothetical protein
MFEYYEIYIILVPKCAVAAAVKRCASTTTGFLDVIQIFITDSFGYYTQGVQMKGIQNKKFISQKLIVIHVSGLCHQKGKL